jgi:V/A-type H+-transporting ATPase subunit F
MRAFLLSDNRDSLLGFRLIGIDGIIISTKEELYKNLDDLYNDNDIALILITTKLALLDISYISELKIKNNKKILLEVPDRHSFDDYGHKLDQYMMQEGSKN